MRANILYHVVALAVLVASAAGKTSEDHPLARMRTGSNGRRRFKRGTTIPVGPAETQDFRDAQRNLDEATIASLFQLTAQLKMDAEEVEDEQVNSLSMSMDTFPPSPTPTPAVPAPEPTFTPTTSTNEPTPPRVGPPPSDCCTSEVVPGSQCGVINEAFPPRGFCDDQDLESRCCINDSLQVDCFGDGDSGCVTECTDVTCPEPTGIPTPSPIVDTPLPTFAPAPLTGSPTSEPVTDNPTSTPMTPVPTTLEPTFEPTQTAEPTAGNVIGTDPPTSSPTDPTSIELCCTQETTEQCDRDDEGLFPPIGSCDGVGGSDTAVCCVVSGSDETSCVEPTVCSVDCTDVACFGAPSSSPTELPTVSPTSDGQSTNSPTAIETVPGTFSIGGNENLFQVIDGSPASGDTDQLSVLERASSNILSSSSPSPTHAPSPRSSLSPHAVQERAGSPSSSSPRSSRAPHGADSDAEQGQMFLFNMVDIPSFKESDMDQVSTDPSQTTISQFSQVGPPQSVASASTSTTSTSSAAQRTKATIVYYGIVTVLAILFFPEI